MQKQLSDAWFDTRKGKLTGSHFGDILAKPTTKRYQDYMQDVINGLLGVPDFSEKDQPWFAHGKSWEEEARFFYEWETGNDVKQAFFDLHPKLAYVGCSVDGYVTPGILEIKSHKSLAAYLSSINKLESKHRPQVYGELWVTGAEWCDFTNFYKNELTGQRLINVLRVDPDLEYHKKLEAACIDFWSKIQERLKG